MCPDSEQHRLLSRAVLVRRLDLSARGPRGAMQRYYGPLAGGAAIGGPLVQLGPHRGLMIPHDHPGHRTCSGHRLYYGQSPSEWHGASWPASRIGRSHRQSHRRVRLIAPASAQGQATPHDESTLRLVEGCGTVRCPPGHVDASVKDRHKYPVRLVTPYDFVYGDTRLEILANQDDRSTKSIEIDYRDFVVSRDILVQGSAFAWIIETELAGSVPVHLKWPDLALAPERRATPGDYSCFIPAPSQFVAIRGQA